MLRPAIRIIFYTFLFSFFLYYLSINRKPVLAGWCDPTWCGGPCVCGTVHYVDIQASCVKNSATKKYTCSYKTFPHSDGCCPNWGYGSCSQQGGVVWDCSITNNGYSCSEYIKKTNPLKACTPIAPPSPPPGGDPGGGGSCICGDMGGTYCARGSESCPSGTHSVGPSCDSWPCDNCCVPDGGGGGGGGGGEPPPPSGAWAKWCDVGCGLSKGGKNCLSHEMLQKQCNCTTSNCPAAKYRCKSPDSACTPSCSVSLSFSSSTIDTGQATVATANVNSANLSLTRINFSSSDTALATVDPASDTSSPYRVSVFGLKPGTVDIQAQVVTSPALACNATGTLNIESNAWFQTQGGNVYTGAELSSEIPLSANDPNFSLKLDNWPGIITHQDENGVNLGDGFPANSLPNYWLAKSSYEGKSYGSSQFFKKKFALDLTSETYVQGREDLPVEDGVYYAQSSRTLSGSSWTLGDDRWVVLIVDGDVNVETNITVPEGSFLAIVATGNINFAEDISQAQGMFVADGDITTKESDQVFEGQGIFSAGSFSLLRDFADERNDTTPIETFIARPDFMMSSYKDATYNVWWFFKKWQEIAP